LTSFIEDTKIKIGKRSNFLVLKINKYMKKKIKIKALAVKKSSKKPIIKSLECWGC